jgi:ubiquinone/menaquinone biosynthesis C-methylase UbiE
MDVTNAMSPEKAWLYEKYRLPYADAAVDDLLERLGTPQRIADIGAGTGQLARMFAKRCETVFAIEPDAAMRQVASSVLATLAGVDIRDGTAERTTLGDQSVELIVVGNAFHRFRPECSDEFRRILKPNGWIALYSYRFINQEFAGMLFPRLARLRRIADRIEKAWHKTPTETLFGANPLARLHYRQIQSEDWTAFFGSACSGIEAPDRQDPEYSEFEAINREVFATFAVDGEITIDYETEVVYGKPA